MRFKPKLSLLQKKRSRYQVAFYPTISHGDGSDISTDRQTWTVPAGVSAILVEMIGGGGGGGRAATNYAGATSSTLRKCAAAAGGSGGMYLACLFSVTPGQSIVVCPGAGGHGANQLTHVPSRVNAYGGLASYIEIAWRSAEPERIVAHGGYPGGNTIKLSSSTGANITAEAPGITWDTGLGGFPGDTAIFPAATEADYFGYVPWLGGTLLAFYGESGYTGFVSEPDLVVSPRGAQNGGNNGRAYVANFANLLSPTIAGAFGGGNTGVAGFPLTSSAVNSGVSTFANGGLGNQGGGGEGGITRSVMVSPGRLTGTTAVAAASGGRGGDGMIVITYLKYDY